MKKKAEPLSDSDSDLGSESNIRQRPNSNFKKINNKRFTGGLIVRSDADQNDQQANMSLSAAEKMGLKEVADLERELDLKNTFSCETNKRDEDAEMNKYINEKMKLRRQAEDKRRVDDPINSEQDNLEFSDILTMSAHGSGGIDDILLYSLSKDSVTKHDEKSEAMLSSQMLNGVPEVDLETSELASNSGSKGLRKGDTRYRPYRSHSNDKSRFARPRR